MTDETKARFLAGIAAQVPAERVAEVHLFGAIRQGGQESGVAVIAVQLPGDERTSGTVESDAGTPDDALPDDASTDALPQDSVSIADVMPTRYTVYTARFRHTLKGPERGKWELAVTEEADAPLLTVDAVVRGVSRRSGEADETIRLSGDEFRAALPEPARA
ncbi:MAG TPA: hypothetical protein VFP15_06890 [Gemmatimonadaceae bacterium]|nr:hypothetical protein [Gemmatimonadaceae bacterium]